MFPEPEESEKKIMDQGLLRQRADGGGMARIPRWFSRRPGGDILLM
jgi:hypothetical protein